MEKLIRRNTGKGPYIDATYQEAEKSEAHGKMIMAKNDINKNFAIIPNVAALTKMFTSLGNNVERPFYKKWEQVEEYIDGTTSLEIFKKYDQLDQLDLTAYLWLLRMAGPDLTVKCSAYDILKMMGKENDPKSYRWLEGFLERITTSSFCFYKKYMDGKRKRRMRFIGSLANFYAGTDDGRITVSLSAPMAALLEDDGWSFINMKKRKELGHGQTAQTFHSFVSSTKCPKNGMWFAKKDLKEKFGPNHKNTYEFTRYFKGSVLPNLIENGVILEYKETKKAMGFWWVNSKKNTKDSE